MNKTYFIILFIFLVKSLSAQTLYAKIDALGAELSDNQAGVSVLVAKGDSIIFDSQFGFAEVELEVPLTKKHLFRIGSITKQFTAVSILKLHQQGRLSIRDRLSKYLNDYPNGDNITLLQLLNHTSGISNYTSLEKWTNEERKRDFIVDQLIEYFKNEGIEFEPGTDWKYNDSGYVLLGKVIEEVVGTSYAKYISSELGGKLNLKNTRADHSAELIINRAKGYQMNNSVLENAPYLSTTQPYSAGGIISTIDDVWKWNRLIFHGDYLAKDLLELAHSETSVNQKQYPYGLGWQIDYPQNIKALYHHGWINGFFTTAWYLPSTEIFVAVFTNCTCKDPRPVAKEIINMMNK